jgi:4-alpha-glucanotransferase
MVESPDRPTAPSAHRIAGVLVPLFSLRTARSYGIGEIPDLVDFARLCREHGQRLVQVLPIGELSDGETSPYSASSSFAIDPMYIAIEGLEDLAREDLGALLGSDGEATLARIRAAKNVDYGTVRPLKRRILRAAFERFLATEWTHDSPRARAMKAFAAQHADWLADYAHYRALKNRFGGTWWPVWPEGVKRRDPVVLARHARELETAALEQVYLQWIANEQWAAMRREVNGMGVQLMGDLPFVVGVDSGDVWGRQRDFFVDADLGAPPDAFSPEGQTWGLPPYDLDEMDRNDLAWLRERATEMGRLYDSFRVDHLVGYYRMWVKPKGQPARFIPGEHHQQVARGDKMVSALIASAASAGARIVAEDLGVIPDFVRASLAKHALPGYRVLFWERDGDVFRDPAKWPAVSLATTGTHDTDPLATWWEAMGFDERRHALADIPSLRAVAARRDVDKFGPEVHDAILDALYGAGSDWLLLPIQDVLGTRERVNTPATVGAANWSYRLAATIEELRRDPAAMKRFAVVKALAAKHGR